MIENTSCKNKDTIFLCYTLLYFIDANLSYKSTCSSSSPVLTRGEIAPARLFTYKQESDHLSPNSMCFKI